MLRVMVLLLAFGSGYFTVFPARAAFVGCAFDGVNYLGLGVPQMAIPADIPDGTVLYTSPKMTRRVNCTLGGYGFINKVVVATTADYNQFLALKNGIKFTVYIDGVAYDKPMTGVLGIIDNTVSKTFSKDISVWFDIKVDSSHGKIPVSGTMLSGGFESLYVMLEGAYSDTRGVISLYTPNITYIPCSMDVSVSPDTIDFGAINSSDLEKGIKLQRKFSTLIKKSKGCMIALSAPFGISMFFEPTNPVFNADGSLSLNNGLGLTISDTTGRNIAYNSAWKIDDVKVESLLKNYFTANLQKVSGQDIKTGPFSADVVVRLSYY
ncbi:fimbrial protein [Salmonella enterica]|nr:fimbrial protein [Salmonella enterica]ELG1987015.1 fimbrial protein [Salmonella enterica]